MESRVKLTANVSPKLLLDLKHEAIDTGATYSDLLSYRIRSFFGDGDIKELQQRIKKHQHAGEFINRGRPSSTFIQENGPLFNKKATFYFPASLCRTIRKTALLTGYNVSALINLSLSYSPAAPDLKNVKS